MSVATAAGAAAGRLHIRLSVRRPGLGTIGVVIVGGFVLLAITSLWLSPYRSTQPAGDPLEAPSLQHLLGTNGVGQDVFSQVFAGTRVSLFMGVVAGGGTVLLGLLFGALAGWLGGRADAVMMRVVDVVMVVPSLPLLIVLGTYAGTSLVAIAAIIALTSWPGPARVLRSQVLSLRSRAHLRAAVGFGAGTLHVIRRHVVPEISLILVSGMVGSAGRAVMMEAGLAFLGLGDPTQASWGAVMRDALNFRGLFDSPAWRWWLIPPIVAIVLLLLGLVFIGLSLEQRLHPRLARHAGGGRRTWGVGALGTRGRRGTMSSGNS